MTAAPGRRLRLLVLSWNYPTPAAPQRGLWVERMCDAAAQRADVTVIVPTPWVPPLMPLQALSRFRRIPPRERRGQVELHFPRVPGSIEYHTHGFDARMALPAVLRLARRLHQANRFDLIHAHFIYPDGVVASRLGRELGVPVMTSEHAFWTPWLVDQPRVAAQVGSALPGLRLVTTVSHFLRRDVDQYFDGRADTAVLPNVVDDLVFTPAPRARDLDQLLYVGLIRKFKRIDVLLRAVAEARRTLPALHLRVLSANAYRAYGADRRQMRQLIAALGLERAVQVENGADPPAVAEAMRRCGFVVVSSTRRETFCSVAAEALACGTPLVLTRCGGPEEFVTADDGVMVAADDPSALAEGIIRARERSGTFDAEKLRARIVGRFGREAWSQQAMTIYERVAASAAGERNGKIVSQTVTTSASATLPGSGSDRLPALDGVRALAVLGVIASHSGLFGLGWIGVDIFFGLSGYLITGILIDAKSPGTSAGGYFVPFYVRRSLRILPLAWAVIIIMAAVRGQWGSLGWYIGYLVNWLPQSPAPRDLGHYWSLAVEEQFYLVWPAVVFCLGPRALWRATIAIIAIDVAFRLAVSIWPPDFVTAQFRDLATFARADTLAVGALLAQRQRRGGWGREVSWALPAGLGAGAAMVAIYKAEQFGAPVLLTYNLKWPLLALGVWGGLLFVLTRPPRILQWRWLVWIGQISYGVYVIHALFGGWLHSRFTLSQAPLIFVLQVAVTVPLAAASWYLFESPILRLKRHWPMPSRRPAGVAPGRVPGTRSD